MLSVNHITKLYDSQSGVADIHFACDAGKIISVIGPNGSGKTTLLKIIAGILKADTGSYPLMNMTLPNIWHERLSAICPTAFHWHAA